jgi:vacuolar-type H+-ATPase subunit E/Vma4
LREDAETAAASQRAEILRSKEAELRAALRLELSRARADGRRRALEARNELLARIFADAHQLLGEAIQHPTAREYLAARAQEALGFVPEGDALITCSPGVAAVLEGRLAAHPDLRIETREDLPPGFQFTAAGGALLIDATLEKLLELERPALAIEVLRRLAAGTP